MVLEKLLSNAHAFSFVFVSVVDVYHGVTCELSFQSSDVWSFLGQCFLIPSDYHWVSCDLSFQCVDGGPAQGQSVSSLV